MKSFAIVSVIFFAACLCPRLDAQEFEIPAMQHLKDAETIRAAHLSVAETKEILDQVESTSFDVPESWGTELRVRRQQIGGTEGLIIQATKGLCGATGNCQTWAFRRSAGKWLAMFEKQAPIVSGYAFGQQRDHGIEDFIGAEHISAEISSYAVFTFDGKFYRLTECYQRDGDNPVKKVPCG
ncbi:MAG: hypothetical protein M3O09_09445 [Acidobacteriota bacterium]|nr:hypothetical protein [Acidobacteriota bacterium]